MTVTEELQALVDGGLSAIPPAEFADVSSRCWLVAVETGDARYAIVARLLDGLWAWWSESGAVPRELAAQIDEILRASLGAVLTAPTPREGSRLAATLLADIHTRQLGSQDWCRRGYVASGTHPHGR